LGVEVVVARSFWARLRGLALRRRPGAPLLIPRCRSVHTFGMRFPLHLVWLDRHGRVVGLDRSVPPNRLRTGRDAAAVLEVPAVEGSEMILAMAEGQRNRFMEALDPRVPIYRDTYNEYFVFVLSAGGAVAGTQVPLYIVMAITGLWDVVPFVLACVVFELAVIFGVARPQMQPRERVAWAALWAAATAALAFAFWHLVASPTL
jgi:uncharacterized membrane protein (UPF0127 family)